MSVRKRTSLEAVFESDALTPSSRDQTRSAKRNAKESEHAEPAHKMDSQERAGQPKRPKVKQHTAYLPLAVHEQLRKLAFEEDRKMHDYLVEGLDRVFADRGLPPVRDLS